MTPRYRSILVAVIDAWLVGGPLPTARGLCSRFGWASTNNASEGLAALEANGVLRRPVRGGAYGLVLEHPEVAELVAARRAA